MSNMFKNSVFSSLNLKSFDTSKVIDMSNMFDTTTVPSLDLSSFNTSKVGTMNNMFANFDTIKNMVLNDYLYSPADLNVSSFKGDGLSASDAIDSMFMDARLKDINMPYFKVSSDTVTSGSEVFNDIAADSVSIPNFDGSKIQNWSQFFSGADINKLDISTWNISNNDSSMFDDSHIKQITLGPANKFTANTYLPTSDETTEKDKWISISPNGVVDSPENAKTFYASPSEGTRGMSNYDDLGGVSVLSFVPDVDITDKVI
jgi:bacterial surface protein 26-residue repeat